MTGSGPSETMPERSQGARYVREEVTGQVATLTLDSPHNRNALSSRLMSQLLAALGRAVEDERVRVIVLSHTGTVFCAGADLKATAARDSPELPVTGIPELLHALWTSPKPVVARIAGAARAGGLGLIGADDVAVASATATFAVAEVRRGVVPAVISATVLPRPLPRAATELFLTGDVVDGRRAAEIGLVTVAVPPERVDGTVAGYVDSLLRGAPGALAGTKALLHRARGPELDAELRELTEVSTGYFRSEEGREGVAAFLEKRPPRWAPPGKPTDRVG